MKKERIPQYIILVLVIAMLIQNHSLSNILHNDLIRAQSDLQMTKANVKRTEKLLNKMKGMVVKSNETTVKNSNNDDNE